MSTWVDEDTDDDCCRCDVRGCAHEAVMHRDHEGKLAPPEGWTRYERNRMSHPAHAPALDSFVVVCDTCTALGASKQDNVTAGYFVFELVLREVP